MPLIADSNNNPTQATLKIPFDTARNAEIAFRVLNVDQEPRRNFVQKELKLADNQLEVHFTADQVKNLRTAITSFFEALLLCSDTIKAFDNSEEKIAASSVEGNIEDEDAGTLSGTDST